MTCENKYGCKCNDCYSKTFHPVNNCECILDMRALEITMRASLNDIWTRQKLLEEKVGKLESSITKDKINITTNSHWCNELENKIDKLTKDFESKLDVDYEKWVQYFNEIHPKKPHKCLVCDGFGGIPHPLTGALVPGKCHSCEGKGIVWG